jgi:extradiol dioxygenase family protein
MAQIRHMAIFSEDPTKLANYYADVFGMTITGVGRNGDTWITDGHLDIAIIPRLNPDYPPAGLHHFGFSLDPAEKPGVYERMAAYGIAPTKPPADRPFVEDKGRDLDGNIFDMATSKVESDGRGRVKEKVAEPAG